jgi:hypothetical protein
LADAQPWQRQGRRDRHGELEAQFIEPYFEVANGYPIEHLDHGELEGLEVRPPEVWRYFLRVKPQVLARFAGMHGLEALAPRRVEDEFVYQNTFRLNQAFYASPSPGGRLRGEKRAFVLCHGRDLVVLKIVGYAEQVVSYYRLEDQTARVWVAHQRYPTKGRVWHPGGAHPFIGVNEALVHNGDFANYHALTEYLRQRNMVPLFLTDTEVGAQLFALWDRVYAYPLEVTLEAMAPTTGHDLAMLAPEKQGLYQAIQRAHLHGSPDGPWFFILARSLPDENRYELLGITDTSMLRPQVFALYENQPEIEEGVQIGLIASERQAINACLRSLAAKDGRFRPVADRYWVARGGSHTDGGAFCFSYAPERGLICRNKFGHRVLAADPLAGRRHPPPRGAVPARATGNWGRAWEQAALRAHDNGGSSDFWNWLRPRFGEANWDELAWGLAWLCRFAAHGDEEWEFARLSLTLLRDRTCDPGKKRRASILSLVDGAVGELLGLAPPLDAHSGAALERTRRLDWTTREALRPPVGKESALVIDTLRFPPEGEHCAARWLVRAYELGWRHLMAYDWRGGRFAGCGLGPASDGARLELYGDVGDYAASGLDGAEVVLHGDGQDQLGQILKRGKLVVHGDVGQTFMYGAKGGAVYVRGSAAGRPLINAVGHPRAVINGTCLDYLAESFMAGDPLEGGGFVVLNGVAFDEGGELVGLEMPYPGGNLFSLASGGAIYVRDPWHRVEQDQLHGGRFGTL